MEIDMGIGVLEFGSGITRFPGLVYNFVGVWSSKISSLFAWYINGTLLNSVILSM